MIFALKQIGLFFGNMLNSVYLIVIVLNVGLLSCVMQCLVPNRWNEITYIEL